jgi:hypothetical protein
LFTDDAYRPVTDDRPAVEDGRCGLNDNSERAMINDMEHDAGHVISTYVKTDIGWMSLPYAGVAGW